MIIIDAVTCFKVDDFYIQLKVHPKKHSDTDKEELHLLWDAILKKYPLKITVTKATTEDLL
jgi:hypothetical protein